ncbi:hypothetical protein EZ428_12435 [Pedobacter frigiditerrae]|uniref:Uncharacterized protein n=1 Tax=Pedobacter frigiditerrae TaxID=2530452 RepID=A0A4R0MSX0_9SPHI|nr:hypothetical protein [Pedobacter frigiditerrae]TCC90090.1 hypothetical protein EZ428_12435 [Pedobacter frigiditerrae]
MVRVFVVLLFFCSLAEAKAELVTNFANVENKLQHIAEVTDTIKRLPPMSSQAKIKFVYAELLCQRLYGENKFSLNGDSLGEDLKKSVAQVKYRESALDLLGAEGWELSVAVTREVNAGFEIFYYLKKRID